MLEILRKGNRKSLSYCGDTCATQFTSTRRYIKRVMYYSTLSPQTRINHTIKNPVKYLLITIGIKNTLANWEKKIQRPLTKMIGDKIKRVLYIDLKLQL